MRKTKQSMFELTTILKSKLKHAVQYSVGNASFRMAFYLKQVNHVCFLNEQGETVFGLQLIIEFTYLKIRKAPKTLNCRSRYRLFGTLDSNVSKTEFLFWDLQTDLSKNFPNFRSDTIQKNSQFKMETLKKGSLMTNDINKYMSFNKKENPEKVSKLRLFIQFVNSEKLKIALRLVDEDVAWSTLTHVKNENGIRCELHEDKANCLKSSNKPDRMPVSNLFDCIRFRKGNEIHAVVAPVTVKTVIDRMARGIHVSPEESMRYEMLRFATFQNYPEQDKPFRIRFAQAGFYYAANKDEVVCYCCRKRLGQWSETDDPMAVHLKMSPTCRFLKENAEVNFPLGNYTNVQLPYVKTKSAFLKENSCIGQTSALCEGGHQLITATRNTRTSVSLDSLSSTGTQQSIFKTSSVAHGAAEFLGEGNDTLGLHAEKCLRCNIAIK